MMIKICGLRHPEQARQAAESGADFIGIVFHPRSRRFVGTEQAKQISQAVKSAHAIPVGIFVNHSAKQMHEIAAAVQIQVLQLHGAVSRQQHHLLPKQYQRIYVQTVAGNGVINPDDDGGLVYCDPERDFLLLDSVQAGQGQTFKWDQCHYRGQLRLGLAGGLNANNIDIAIKTIHPSLVDISSGVENSAGEKDMLLIQQFIHTVRDTAAGVQYAR